MIHTYILTEFCKSGKRSSQESNTVTVYVLMSVEFSLQDGCNTHMTSESSAAVTKRGHYFPGKGPRNVARHEASAKYKIVYRGVEFHASPPGNSIVVVVLALLTDTVRRFCAAYLCKSHPQHPMLQAAGHTAKGARQDPLVRHAFLRLP